MRTITSKINMSVIREISRKISLTFKNLVISSITPIIPLPLVDNQRQ